MNERIKKIREAFCGDNNKQFAEALGVSPQYASNITKAGKNVGDKQLDNILEKFPNIDPVWLKMGIGEMLKSDKKTSESDTITMPREVWNLLQEQLKTKDEQIMSLLRGNKAGVESPSFVVRAAAAG